MRIHLSLILAVTALCSLLPAAAAAAGADAGAGAGGPQAKIIGGTLATRAWPAQGALESQGCGGTLVSARWFLTAGHCITSASPSAYAVALGKSDLAQVTAADRYSVDRVELHPRFDIDFRYDYDLALLHISSPVAPPQEPLRIVTAGETGVWAADTIATIIGWGTCGGCGTSTDKLREATVPIRSDASCSAAYPGDFNPATMVCAGNGATDACQGDSGGPLMVPRAGEFVLAGITSSGRGCANPSFPGVYTRIGAPELNQWIRDRIPTVAIATAPASPLSADSVQLTASASPAPQSYSWDLDDDGEFDDDADGGPTASLGSVATGARVVRVQAAYADGDRALSREVVTVTERPPPPAPPPPPPPAVTPPPAATVVPTPRAAAKPIARLYDVPSRVSLGSLLDGRTSVRVRCYAACNLKATLRFDGAAARRLGFARLSDAARIGSGSARFAKATTARVTIKLTRIAISRLRRVRSANIALRVTATAGSRRQQLDELLALRR